MSLVELNDTIEAQFATQRSKWMQKKQTMRWTDLHGRHYSAMTRFQNNPFPVWVNNPSPDGWKPPAPELFPPAQFMVPVRGNRIQIAYAKWRESLRVAYRERKDYRIKAATDLYGRKAGDALNADDQAVWDEVGTMPLNPLFVDAMEAGDLWALGIPRADGTPREVPEWAAPLMARLKSTQKAEDAAEAKVTKSMFITSDAPVLASRPFVPSATYDEVDTAPARKRSHKRAPVAIMDEPEAEAVETEDDE